MQCKHRLHITYETLVGAQSCIKASISNLLTQRNDFIFPIGIIMDLMDFIIILHCFITLTPILHYANQLIALIESLPIDIPRFILNKKFTITIKTHTKMSTFPQIHQINTFLVLLIRTFSNCSLNAYKHKYQLNQSPCIIPNCFISFFLFIHHQLH